MGKRGPVPEPSALKRTRGVRPSRLNHSEPMPSAGAVAVPEFLAEEAREVWDQLAPDLIRAEVLTGWDVLVFAELCELAVTVRRARTALEAGFLVKRPVGGREEEKFVLVTNPAWRIYRDALAMLVGLAREFGLTPSARSQLRLDLPIPPGLSAEGSSQAEEP